MQRRAEAAFTSIAPVAIESIALEDFSGIVDHCIHIVIPQRPITQPKLIVLKPILNSQPKRFCIEVSDNGMGIAQENLTRIFQYGFTTRHQGHGFGLYSSAIAAADMGGTY
jgi:signal transduction histidine kinase